MSYLNGVMMQYFHWYIPPNGNLWNDLAENAVALAEAGVTAIWTPPAYKGIGGAYEVGYAVYDFYDLGEFDQKGSVHTKYGTKQEYINAVEALKKVGIQTYADAVLNHMIGGDEPETFKAVPFHRVNRCVPKGPPKEISSYTKFCFPGRAGVHSDFKWQWNHFDGVDHDINNPSDRMTVHLIEGKQFDDHVSTELGNFAYLLGCDLDFQNPEVRDELLRWGKWYLDTTGVEGFRLDAIKHISSWFFPEWLDALEKHAAKDLFIVGEYWINDRDSLVQYINAVGERMCVFDVPLHFNFHNASRSGSGYDMSRILDGSLVQICPTHAVTFVDNHDSQPLQALESVVESWFKPLAYALILLRREGYPCLFHADYYGAEYEDRGWEGGRQQIVIPSHRKMIDVFLRARRTWAYGPQYDYFDHTNTIGWTRLGDSDHSGAMAVLMGNGLDGNKWMETGKPDARFEDITGHVKEPVHTNEYGWGEFRCLGGSVSVWIMCSEHGT